MQVSGVGQLCYIVAQAPSKYTVNDFWHLIWQENISVVVMMTRCVVSAFLHLSTSIAV